MKIRPNLILTSILTATLLLNSRLAHATVSLNVSPAGITNDYTGNVTLTITGLAINQKVLVERYYDLNGNGLIDAGQDFVIQSFKVTDGQLPLIGGVRDRNVPGDDDGAANGQIQIKLDYPGINTVPGGATGNFVFRVADTNGATLATQVFSVAQKVWPQGVRGRITSVASGLPLTNTVAAMINPNNDKNSPVLAVTDTNGNYTFYATAGSYVVLVVGSGFVSDQNAGSVTVPTNTFATNNLALAGGAYTISGSVKDASDSKPLVAVFVNGQSTNSLFSGVFTDTNGNFSFPVASSQWKVKIDQGGIAQKGYLSPQNNLNVTVTNSNVANVNIALAKTTALIYGTLKTSLSNAIIGVEMDGSDSGNLYQATGLTGTNGAYSLGVVAGSWYPGPSGNQLAALGYSGGSSTNVNLTDGQAIEVDFVLQGVTAHLRGQVKDDHGNPITNITIVVQPYPVQGNGANSMYPTTDNNGNFDAGVHGGAWNIALECVSAENRGYVNISGFNYTVTDGVDQNGLVLNFPQSTAVINGRVTDTSGHPIVGLTLNANQQINSTNFYFPGCVSTDNNGYYQIKVLSGTWMVNVANGDLNAMGYGSVNSSNVTISGGTATANFVAPFNIAAPQFTTGGYSPSTGASFTITGTVGHTNTVQYSSNLTTWLTLTNTVLSNSTWQVTDPTLNQPKRFYRAVVSP
jgi:uncharacterized GH25 family protein